MAKICTNCGAQLDDNAGFCTSCGTKVDNTVQQAPPPPPVQQQAPPPPPAQQQYAPPPPPPAQQQYAPPPPPAQQQYAPPPPPPAQQQYAPPPPPGQQQYAPPPPQGQQQYAPPPPPPGQQGYAPPPPPPGQQGYGPPPGQQQYYAPPPAGENGFTKAIYGFFKNAKDETDYMDPADIAQNKAAGGLAYLWVLFFLPLVMCPQSRYGRFHANQGLLFLIFWVILAIVGNVVSWLLLFGGWHLYFISSIVWVIIWLFNLLLFITGLINGFTGKARELPIIGKFRIIKY